MPDHFPDSPSGTTVLDLAGRWWRNVLALIDHHQQVATLTGDEIRAHAMTALSAGQELTEALAAWMPVLACEALYRGAGPDAVASIVGLDEGRFVSLLTSWAREQRDDERITPDRFREVMHLAGFGWDPEGGGDPR